MTTQYKSLTVLALSFAVFIPGMAYAALAGVNYNTPASGGAPSASEVALASGGGSSAAAATTSTGTPSQKGNQTSVDNILHPQAKNKTTKYPEPMEIDDVETIIMDNSINAYHGPCPCPYSQNSDGYQCGIEAAYYKPGGYRIYCFPEDIRGQLDIFYRKTH